MIPVVLMHCTARQPHPGWPHDRHTHYPHAATHPCTERLCGCGKHCNCCLSACCPGHALAAQTYQKHYSLLTGPTASPARPVLMPPSPPSSCRTQAGKTPMPRPTSTTCSTLQSELAHQFLQPLGQQRSGGHATAALRASDYRGRAWAWPGQGGDADSAMTGCLVVVACHAAHCPFSWPRGLHSWRLQPCPATAHLGLVVWWC
jgi:hypothetical protein